MGCLAIHNSFPLPVFSLIPLFKLHVKFICCFDHTISTCSFLYLFFHYRSLLLIWQWPSQSSFPVLFYKRTVPYACIIFPFYFIFSFLPIVFFLNFYIKNFDYPEKPLKYKHIRRISDWFYYQFTTFNGLRLDMPEHLASMKQPNTNATHWRRGTSAITQFHIAPHWRRYLIPTGKQGTPLFFYPHVTQ